MRSASDPTADGASRRRALAPVSRRAVAVAAAAAFATAAAATAAEAVPGSFDGALGAAAEANRNGRLDAARTILEPWLASAEAGRARTVLGLLAHAGDDPRAAAELLAAGPGPDDLEDWRLYVLADSRAALGDTAGARQALVELLARDPDSPLRPRAIVRLVELAHKAGDLAAARERIALGRAERLPHAQQVELERLAWRLGVEKSDVTMLADAARRLLVIAPLDAAELRVVDTLNARRPATTDWRLWLDDEELLARSAALLEAELPAGALTTLAALPAERRGVAWQLLDARALVASGRGPEALARLTTIAGKTPSEQAALAWERAQAALEASKSRRGRPVALAESERLRRLAREQLLAAARGTDSELAARALGVLAADYLGEGRLGEAVAAYRQLSTLRPDDRSGARPLWERGWQAYAARDGARAIAIWRDLVALYPAAPSARGARYWTARALDEARQPAQARALYLELLAADTADFYARQAALRLAGARETALRPAAERESWPDDTRLARARALTDAGLDGLARTELELVGASAEPRASLALSALVHARAGDRRASLNELRQAFPALATADQRRVPGRAIELFYPTDFRAEIVRAAAAQGLPPYLVYGIVHQESAFDPKATSSSGARGLMQLLPTTGKEVARKLGLPFATSRLYEPDYGVLLGTRYFRQMLGLFDGNVELALAGYNGGPGRISRLWRAAGPTAELDRFLEGLAVTESRNYVKRILVLAESYRSLYPDLG